MHDPTRQGHIGQRLGAFESRSMAKSPHPTGDQRREPVPPLPSGREDADERPGSSKRRQLKGFHAEGDKLGVELPKNRRKRSMVALSATELDAAMSGPKVRLTPAGQDIDHKARAEEAFERIVRERPVLGPGMMEDTLEYALDQYCLIGKRLIEFFFADESINSATLVDDIERSLRRALAQMNEDRQRRLIAALMSLAGELQSARLLKTVPPARLARVALLIGQAHATAVDEPTATQRANLATVIEHGAEEGHTRDGPPLWRERAVDPETGKRPTAIEWFELHWKSLVLAGEATGDDIRQCDFKFYETLASYQKSKGRRLSDLLPPSPTRGRKDESPEERAERLRRHWRDSKRRARDRQAHPG